MLAKLDQGTSSPFEPDKLHGKKIDESLDRHFSLKETEHTLESFEVADVVQVGDKHEDLDAPALDSLFSDNTQTNLSSESLKMQEGMTAFQFAQGESLKNVFASWKKVKLKYHVVSFLFLLVIIFNLE